LFVDIAPPYHLSLDELVAERGLGLARDEPWVCLARGDSWIFGPEAVYEREGDVGNVVFPCGYTVAEGRDTIHLYYGAADTSIAMATASIRELLDWLDRNAAASALG
jgi:predicted GH43/DUF377 family glycosyl hydrolase